MRDNNRDLKSDRRENVAPMNDRDANAKSFDEIIAAGHKSAVTETVAQALAPGLREFKTGANRNLDTGKHDYDGFLHPYFIEAFGTYMHFNRHLENGDMRDSDNWQLGIPTDVCRKSMWRHFIDAWASLRGHTVKENTVWALMGLVFNVQCIIVNMMKQNPNLLPQALDEMNDKRAKMWADKKVTPK